MAMMGLAFFAIKLSLQVDNRPKVQVTLYHPYDCQLIEPAPRFEEQMEFTLTSVNYGDNDFYFLCGQREIYKVTKNVSRINTQFEIFPQYNGVQVDSVPNRTAD